MQNWLLAQMSSLYSVRGMTINYYNRIHRLGKTKHSNYFRSKVKIKRISTFKRDSIINDNLLFPVQEYVS